ncbi:GUN4 domain-containing protein [Calothrix sp. FACHB-1219]|uniref:GUN4 domain-containing protein n=1 Tax=unclassified Calothrix TaxID=2619626 RepID=UPI001685E16B|nr:MULTISPECIES: GUN4 domain-containing protein [unclassified Calothrix]MBD2204918.1 GUN4 domain-containing protein [Calothrix sp. FACHB-168]MBD2216257.1 GUN4 domain-containing protein [Calothrix sp. FACHB-1219]
MVKNWALVIGINDYKFLQPLKYARRDAKLMQNLLHNDIGFERVFLFADDSPHPHRPNLLQFIQKLFAHPFLEPEDNFWFFFSGHGMIHAQQDYLMLADGHPDDIANTGISLQYLTECFRNSGCENIVMILDACRQQQPNHGGFGEQTQQLADKAGIISILSCRPDETSAEIDTTQQSVFTQAILEGLGVQGQCATVKRLQQYLNFRIPELLTHYKYPLQTPQINSQAARSPKIIVNKYANLAEIASQNLNLSPKEATHSQELAKLEQLWIRTNKLENGGNHHNSNSIVSIAEYLAGSDTQASIYDSPVNILAQPQHQSTVTITEPPSDYLSSESKVNYQQLSALLAAGDWKAAERETVTLMLKIARRETAGWLDIAAINKFPYTDLWIIDQLWVKYSQGRFGFSVQKRIWESMYGEAEGDYQTWTQFGDRIGWRVNNQWRFYSDLNFTANAPEGHFPAAATVDLLHVHQGWVVGLFGSLVGFSALAARLSHY